MSLYIKTRSDDRLLVSCNDLPSVRLWLIVVPNESYKTQIRLIFFQAHNICAMHTMCKNIWALCAQLLFCMNLHISNQVYIVPNYLGKLCTKINYSETSKNVQNKLEKLIFNIVCNTCMLLHANRCCCCSVVYVHNTQEHMFCVHEKMNDNNLTKIRRHLQSYQTIPTDLN